MKITSEEINTIKLVHDLMKRLRLPQVGDEAIKVIGKIEGITFKKSLAEVANSTDADRKNESYIHHVCALITGASLSKLSALGHKDIPIATLISLGKSCGEEFREHLRKASNGDGASIYWVNKKFGKAQPIYEQSENNNKNELSPNVDVSNAESDGNQNPDKKFINIHFFGGKAAICFNASKKGDFNTITLDAGDRHEVSGKVNWKDAIHFQYTEMELINLLAVLIGEQTEAEFKGHGAGKDKIFSIVRQKKSFFMKCSAKNVALKAIPVPVFSAFPLAALIIRQTELNHPSLINGAVVELTKNLSKDPIAA